MIKQNPAVQVVVVLAVGIVLAAAMSASGVVPPILIWGGNACQGSDTIAATCGIPPLGLAVSFGAAAVAANYFRSHRQSGEELSEAN